MEIDIILESDLTPAQIEELAVTAEALGVHAIWASNLAAGRDAFQSLIPAARATTRLGIGVLVVSPWEMHPLKMANALLTLNEYAGGRARMVVSAGGEWVGVMATGRERRVRAAREAIELIKAAATGEFVQYSGQLYRAHGFRAAWAKDPTPLIYAGASKPQMLRMGARCADGVMMSDVPPLSVLDESVGIVRDALKESGRSAESFRISNFWAWHVKADREVSMREARRELILRGWLAPWHLEPFMTTDEIEQVEQHKQAFLRAYTDRSGNIEGVGASLVNKLIDNICFAGDLDDIDRCNEALHRFADAGLTEIALRLHDEPMAALQLIGERVVPVVARG